MKNSLKNFQAWRSRGSLRSLKRWERLRAEGKARFVFITALTYGLTMVGAGDVFERFFYTSQHSVCLGNVIYYLLGGIPIGLIAWSSMESRYQKALHEAHASISPAGQLQSHYDQLQTPADSKTAVVRDS